MTSEQRMLMVTALSWLAAVSLGCHRPSLVAPGTLTSPYDTSRGEALWAVVPLRNETGTTVFEVGELTDAVVRACQQIEGIGCLPQNRVIAEMRGLGMSSITTPEEAAALAGRLGVNGLIVGTVTAYDPYDPPVLGLALSLESGAAGRSGGDLSIDALRGSASESGGDGLTARFDSAPSASVSVVFDGRNHATKMELRRYATGRHEPGHARGWEQFLTSMPLFTEFAAHSAVGRLLDQERLRLARSGAGHRMSSR